MLQLLHRNLQTIWERSSLGMLSLNRKRLFKRFLDWGSVLLKQLYNLDLKFKENWPKKGITIKTSFLGTVIKILLDT